MAEAVNHLFEGVDLDTAPRLFKSTRARDMHNFRLVDIGGNAFEATNVPGNAYDGTSDLGFALTTGFVPLGADTLNGITYVLSRRSVDGVCEIGSFPSPDYTAGTGFVRQYQPLQNWTDAAIPYLLLKGAYDPATDTGPFRTALFEIDCKRIRVKCREDYDGSVNVYYTDNKSPLRVINSGFDQRTGVRNTRLYYQGSFPQVVNAFCETILPPDVDLTAVKTNGILDCGNWFAHFRYVTDSFDSTSFNTEVGPIQISPSNEEKEAFRVHGGSAVTVTNKSIVLTVNTATLDRSYKYVEIAMVRRFSDDSTAAKIVNRLFDIEDMIAASVGNLFDIEITGRELTVDTTAADVIRRKRTDDIVRDIEMIDLYMFGANTTERDWYDDRLRDFALTIEARADDSLVLNDAYPDAGAGVDVQDIVIGDVLYKNYMHTYNYTGYFRSDLYQFGAVFLMKKTGILTPAFPVEGFDHINPGGLLDASNQAGIVRFPKNHVSPYIPAPKQANIMGINFTVNSANVSQWIRDNVQAIYFVRSERRPNLLYQGLILQCFSSFDPLFPRADCNGIYYSPIGEPGFPQGEPDYWTRVRNDSSTHRCAPFLDNFVSDPADGCGSRMTAWLPWITAHQDGLAVIAATTYLWGYRINPNQWPAPSRVVPRYFKHKHGLISPDFCFSQKSFDITVFMEQQGGWTSVKTPATDLPVMNYFWEHSNFILPAVLFDLKRYASLHPLAQWQSPDNNGFASYFHEGTGVEYGDADDTTDIISDIVDPYHFFHHFSKFLTGKRRTLVKNMEMGIVSYLGINSKISEGGFVLGGYNPLDTTDHQTIYNLYFSDPDALLDISQHYNFRSETFFKISKAVELPAPLATDNHLCYRGDCFISRTYLKVLANPKYIPDQTDDNDDGETGRGTTLYGFGHVAGMTLECAFNTAMRNSKAQPAENTDVETFYPEYEVFSQRDFATKLRARESYDFNRGYNKVLSINPHAPFDETLPLQKKRFPNRIFYTDRHIVGAFADAWRRSGIAQHQDYDQRGGEIMAILNNNSSLIVYCRNCIQKPSVNERALANTADGGTIVLGSQVEVLHPKTAMQSEEFGLQNQFAAIRGLHGIYSVDVQRRKILFVGADNQLDILSDSKFIRTGLDGFMELVSSFSDVMVEIGDSPVCSEGFALGYNKKFGEIIFSLTHANISRTIVFNELARCFTWTVDYVSPFYISNNSDFYSCRPDNKRFFYLHDVEQFAGQANYCRFYGDLYANARVCRVQIVVNIAPREIGQEETKLFENIRINSNPQELYRVIYDTEGQQATHFPFIGNAEKYIEPEYEEDFWEFPIRRCDVSKNAYYQPGSEMRGNHILITFEWKTAERVTLKSITTFLSKSFH